MQQLSGIGTKFQVTALATISSWALVTLVVPARISAVEDATAAVQTAKQVTHTIYKLLNEITFLTKKLMVSKIIS